MNTVKDYPPYLDYPKPRKPQTNADRIRAMSDEELAEVILCIKQFDPNASCDLRNTCHSCAKGWLRQPVKEET